MQIKIKDGDMRFLIAVYGSLREHEYNHTLLKQQTKLSTERVKGFLMYDLGPFPAVVKGDGEITVELYSVTLPTFERIHSMEVGAGYQIEYIETSKGRAMMYIFESILPPLVESGDWSEYHEAF